MEKSKQIISKLYTFIKPFLDRDIPNLSEENAIKYLQNSTIGFGITYEEIVKAADEFDLINPAGFGRN